MSALKIPSKLGAIWRHREAVWGVVRGATLDDFRGFFNGRVLVLDALPTLPLPYDDQSFDAVLFEGEPGRRAMTEFRRILRSGGYFGMLSVYSGPPRSNRQWRTVGGILVADEYPAPARTFSIVQRIPAFGRRTRWTRERIVAAIRKDATYTNGPAGLRSAAERRFGSWAEACAAAGAARPKRGRPASAARRSNRRFV